VISAEFRRIVVNPHRGIAMRGHYAEWRGLRPCHPADLRIIFRL